jgi:hypothetical protein
MKSLSVKRKSLTSAWRRSMSSTRKMPEYPGPAYSLPTGEEAAEAADTGIEAAAAEVAEAALGFGGGVAAAAAVEAAGGGGIEYPPRLGPY